MLKIITMNLNGIRAAGRKGFFDWLAKQAADLVCLQETKAQANDLTDNLYFPVPYHCYYADAEQKGYSGVGLYCLKQPQRIVQGLGWKLSDSEGRYLQADYADFSVASLYLPSGSSSEERQQVKFQFMDYYLPELRKIIQSKRPFIICGDWNIAHTKLDIKNWRGNQKNSGFLPEERAWLDTLFNEVGFVDAFRVVNQEADQYTWWSNRGQAWVKNVGWRIDYQIVTPQFKDKVKSATIYKEERFSDHAPLIMEYAI